LQSGDSDGPAIGGKVIGGLRGFHYCHHGF
jgi:hypothetical protein